MKFKKHNHFFRLSKVCVLLFYIPFFIVQVFYNFDINRLTGSDPSSSNYKNSTAGQQNIKFGNTDRSPEKKLNIRLNKRFHPESVPGCMLLTVDVPGYFSSAVLLSGYTNPILFLSPQLTRSLRGPPAIV